jgi:hypothetical protein
VVLEEPHLVAARVHRHSRADAAAKIVPRIDHAAEGNDSDADDSQGDEK